MNDPIRILYLGPRGAGKRSNLRWILDHGVSHAGATDERLTLDLGSLGGVPALLELEVRDPPLHDLSDADGIVLVLDSTPRSLPPNRELCETFESWRPDGVPWVVQWTQRDHPEAMPLHELDLRLNAEGAPAFPANTDTGQGILQTLAALVGKVLARRRFSPAEQARSLTVLESMELPIAELAELAELEPVHSAPAVASAGGGVPPEAFPPTKAERLRQLAQPQLPAGLEFDDAVPDLTARQIGPCQVLTKLGEGGMGAVYLAHHQMLGKRVVVKTLKPSLAQDPRRVQRFFLEARAAARLDHPHIVSVLDVGTTTDGISYIVMQHIEGEDLRRRVEACGRLDPDDATRLVLAVAKALTALHAAGIVHRDVKCENVIETPAGEVKLIDFGLAKDLTAQANLTRPGAFIGTPAYMAPEIGRLPDIDGRVDIYSLGLTYYHLLTGLQPFEGFPIHAVILGRGRLVPPADVHPGLHPDHEVLLSRMLAWNRDDRYADAASLVADLEKRMTDRPLEAAPPSDIFDLDVATHFMGRDPRPIPPTVPPDAEDAEGEGPTRRVPRRRVTRPTPAKSPVCFGPYRVVEAREQGRRFTLYSGWDMDAQEEVRLRRCELGVEPGPVAQRELKAAARFEHARSPRLRTHLIDGAATILVSDGSDARALNGLEVPLAPGPLASVAADVAGVLGDLHDQGMVHGSLRATSVGVDADAHGVLLDLDLAALRLGLAQEHGLSLGAHEAAPPECRSGRRPTPRSDVYALAGVIARALPPDVEARDLRAVCACAMAPRPERRYRDMRALRDDLRRVAQGETPQALPWHRQAGDLVRSAQALPVWARWAGAVLAAALLMAIHVAWQQAQRAEAQSRRLEAVFEADRSANK